MVVHITILKNLKVDLTKMKQMPKDITYEKEKLMNLINQNKKDQESILLNLQK